MANGTVGKFISAGLSLMLPVLVPLGSFGDSLTMTTWYPAPYGVYSQLRATGNAYFAYNGGSVGVGTANPQSLLDVHGRLEQSNADGEIMRFTKTLPSPGNSYMAWKNSSHLDIAYIGFTGSSPNPAFAINNMESGGDVAVSAARNVLLLPAGGSGNVGIGVSSPLYPFHVFTPNANANVGWFESSDINTRVTIKSSSGQWDLISMGETGNKFEFYNPTGAGYVMSLMKDGSVDIGQTRTTWGYKLAVEGTAANYTGVWGTLSDARLKKDIAPMTGGLSLLERLRPVTFRWKDPKKDNEYGLTRGFIAQEVETVVPEWIRTDPEGRKWLQTVGINAVLVEGIQEQQRELEEQRREMADLKSRLEKLEKERVKY